MIDNATVPGLDDVSTRTTFHRQLEPAQTIVDASWKLSGGTVNYLGEWHTHPEPIPWPSGIDLENWARIVQQCHFESSALFFAIVGQSRIGIWESFRIGVGLRVCQLSPVAIAEIEVPNA